MSAYRFETEEEYLRYQISELHRQYVEAAKPCIDRLVEIESLKPGVPLTLTLMLQPEDGVRCADYFHAIARSQSGDKE